MAILRLSRSDAASELMCNVYDGDASGKSETDQQRAREAGQKAK
jgi:hypothetical protein